MALLPTITTIKSHLERRGWLKQSTSRLESDPRDPDDPTDPSDPGDPQVEGDSTVDNDHIGPLAVKLLDINQQLNQSIEREVTAHANRRTQVQTCNTSLKELARVAGHARTSITFRASQESFSPGLSVMFGLRNERPYSGSRNWLLIAADLIRGDAAAVAEKHEPMALPSAKDLAALLAKAEQACKLSDDADQELQQAQEELRGVSDEVGELALDTAAYLRYSLRRFDKSEQRRIMRKFGFTFKGSASEEEPEIVPTAEPEPVEPETEPESELPLEEPQATQAD